MSNPTLDQNALETLRDQLDLQAKFLRATVAQLTGQAVAAPTLPESDLIFTVETLQGHVAGLQNQVSKLTGVAPTPVVAPASPTTPHRANPVSPVSSDSSLDERCRAVNAPKLAKKQQAASLASALLEDVRCGRLSLDAAIERAKAEK